MIGSPPGSRIHGKPQMKQKNKLFKKPLAMQDWPRDYHLPSLLWELLLCVLAPPIYTYGKSSYVCWLPQNLANTLVMFDIWQALKFLAAKPNHQGSVNSCTLASVCVCVCVLALMGFPAVNVWPSFCVGLYVGH